MVQQKGEKEVEGYLKVCLKTSCEVVSSMFNNFSRPRRNGIQNINTQADWLIKK
jgi:hypothetical protein